MLTDSLWINAENTLLNCFLLLSEHVNYNENVINFIFYLNKRLEATVTTHLIPTTVDSSSNFIMWENWLLLTYGRNFTVQHLDQLYVLVSSAHKNARCDIACTVLKVT